MKKISEILLAGTLCASMLPAMPVFAQDEKQPETQQTRSSIRSDLKLLSYQVLNTKGEELSQCLPLEKVNLKVMLADVQLKTSDIFEEGTDLSALTKEQIEKAIDVRRLTDGFAGGSEIKTELISQPDSILMFAVTFENVSWKGKDESFRFSTGYPLLEKQEASLKHVDQKIKIYECTQAPEKEEPAPDPDLEVVPEPEEPEIPAADIPYTGGSSGVSEPVVISAPAPNLIISKYTYGNTDVTASKPFTLEITFYNTSKSLTTENIVMQVETEEGLSITKSSNTFYFESLKPGASQTVKIPMKASGSDKTTSPSVSVNFAYEFVDDSSRLSRTSGERISIPVKEADRFEITEPAVLDEAMVGNELVVSLPYVNKGKGTLYNVAAKVSGELQALQPVQNLGNFEPGKSGTIDMILTPQNPGEQTFKVIVTYENADGEETKKEFPVTLFVSEPLIEDLDMPEEEPMPQSSSESSLSWMQIAIGCAVILIIAGYVIRRHRKKKRADGGFQDEDFDFGDPDENA